MKLTSGTTNIFTFSQKNLQANPPTPKRNTGSPHLFSSKTTIKSPFKKNYKQKQVSKRTFLNFLGTRTPISHWNIVPTCPTWLFRSFEIGLIRLIKWTLVNVCPVSLNRYPVEPFFYASTQLPTVGNRTPGLPALTASVSGWPERAGELKSPILTFILSSSPYGGRDLCMKPPLLRTGLPARPMSGSKELGRMETRSFPVSEVSTVSYTLPWVYLYP